MTTRSLENHHGTLRCQGPGTVQGLNATYNDPTITPAVRIDNPSAHNTPYYDDGGAAGEVAADEDQEDAGGVDGAPASFYFLDIPSKIEDEARDVEYPNPIADVQFQVVIADDTVSGNVHNVTLYGGEWWGYKYWAQDGTANVPSTMPEPASLGLLAIASVGLLARRGRK